MLSLLMNIFGWLGASLLLIPYFMVSTGRISGKSTRFQLFNIFGSILLTANSLYYGALPSVFVNLVWISIGIISLKKITSQEPTDNV